MTTPIEWFGEHCGEPGEPRPDGWIKTLCDNCYKK